MDNNINIEENLLEPFLNLKGLLSQKVEYQSNENFLTFVKRMAPSIVSDFKMGNHIRVISDKLQDLEEGKIKRLMVFLPPRSSKSVICSKLFPAWYIGRHPEHEILTVSHSDQLSSDFGRSVRDVVNTEEFQKIFRGVQLRSDVRAAGKWKTNQGGMYYAAGVRSQIAGRGAHIAILDDVMSEEDSFSEAGRRYIKEWYPAGLRTRIMPNGAIVMTAANPFTSVLIASNISMFKYSLVWKKSKISHFAQAPYRFLTEHEDVVVFSNVVLLDYLRFFCKYPIVVVYE